MALKVLFWFPRVLVIIAIIFMIMFSFDVFGGDEPFGKQVLGFLAHNIPAFILIISLIVAWKYEIIGGIIFIVISAALMVKYRTFAGNPGSLAVVAPFLITGIMFVLHKVLAGQGKNENSET